MSSYAALHDYCRSQRIPLEKVEISEGPLDQPSWLVTVICESIVDDNASRAFHSLTIYAAIVHGVANPSAITIVGAPAATKKAARRITATRALRRLGQAIPEDKD